MGKKNYFLRKRGPSKKQILEKFSKHKMDRMRLVGKIISKHLLRRGMPWRWLQLSGGPKLWNQGKEGRGPGDFSASRQAVSLLSQSEFKDGQQQFWKSKMSVKPILMKPIPNKRIKEPKLGEQIGKKHSKNEHNWHPYRSTECNTH